MSGSDSWWGESHDLLRRWTKKFFNRSSPVSLKFGPKNLESESHKERERVRA